MEIQPLESIIEELQSADWLVAASAARKLKPHGEAAVAALKPLFALTLHAKPVVKDVSRNAILNLGKHAVPFLCDRARDESPQNREIALLLLSEAGNLRMTSTMLVEQILDSRNGELPDWGTAPEEMFSVFTYALQDESLSVRFTAASALEEFGRNISVTIPVFIEVLEHGTIHQKNWSALHLGRIGPMAIATTDALIKVADLPCEDSNEYIQSTFEYTRLAATNALKRIRGMDQKEEM